MKVAFSILLLFTCTYSFSKEKKVRYNKDVRFFIEQYRKEKSRFTFNQYEHLISGASAFLIGNIGYLATDSSALKLAYSGIQTIGIINIGKGVYLKNSPNLKNSFYKMLTTNKVKRYSKPLLAKNLLKIFALEERAKRLSLFYSSSFLAAQYLLNATVYDSPERIKNIYVFLTGINTIIAVYSGIYKSDYEKQYFGEDIDINPFAFQLNDDFQAGISLTYNF